MKGIKGSGERSRVVRVKISVTVDEELVRWMEELINRGLFRNRSHAVEIALRRMKRNGVRRVMEELIEGERRDRR